MFYSLSGTLTGKRPQSIQLLTGGVEWELSVTMTTLNDLPSVGNETRIFTHLHHKEDAMVLYGFSREGEKSLFLDLIKVNGVGPRAALKILSGIPVQEFVQALDSEDVDRLCRIPGLGKKGAQKIILALRGKLTLQEEWDQGIPGGEGDQGSEGISGISRRDLTEALINMGFEKRRVEKALKVVLAQDSLMDVPSGEAEAEALRRAIVELSRQG